MSSGKSDPAGLRDMEAEFPPLIRTLMQGLHAAAQPLTVLRVRLDEEYAQTLGVDELRRIVTESVPPVDRLCSLVGAMQQLLTIESLPPFRNRVDAAALLRGAVDGVQLLYLDAGILLAPELPSGVAEMEIDGKRLEQAVTTALFLTRTLVAEGDIVRVQGQCDEQGLAVTLRTPGRSLEKLTADNHLSLAILESALRTQGGSATWELDPFELRMNLPVHHPGTESTEAVTLS